MESENKINPNGRTLIQNNQLKLNSRDKKVRWRKFAKRTGVRITQGSDATISRGYFSALFHFFKPDSDQSRSLSQSRVPSTSVHSKSVKSPHSHDFIKTVSLILIINHYSWLNSITLIIQIPKRRQLNHQVHPSYSTQRQVIIAAQGSHSTTLGFGMKKSDSKWGPT